MNKDILSEESKAALSRQKSFHEQKIAEALARIQEASATYDALFERLRDYHDSKLSVEIPLTPEQEYQKYATVNDLKWAARYVLAAEGNRKALSYIKPILEADYQARKARGDFEKPPAKKPSKRAKAAK